MNTTQLKEFVQLGQASYADYDVDSYFRNDPSQDNARKALVGAANGTFAAGEADQFLSRYGVLDQYTDPGINGFSATVFQDKDNPTASC